MAKANPVAFTDVIEGEIVGGGYDSLSKQMVSRVDNLRRKSTSISFKRQVIGSSEGEDTPLRKRRLDIYTCNWQPKQLPPDETFEFQKHAQEELKKIYQERCYDTKAIETVMRTTFFTQRRDIISGTETSDLAKECPYLFETTGMKTHFKEVTGVDIDEKAIASKCASVVSFFKSTDKTGKMETIFRQMETSSKNFVDVNAAGFLQLLLKYFNEEEEQMFHKVDQTTLPAEVDYAELPSTPCIVLSGGRQNKRCVKAYEVFDFETRSWTTLPSLPCKRSYSGVVWDETGRLYWLGGLRQGGSHQSSKFTKNINIFDTNKGLWLKSEDTESMKTKRADFASASLHGRVIVAGGLGNHPSVLDSVEAFHPEKKKWERVAPMSVPRCSASSIVIRDRLLVVGGVNQTPSSANEILYVKENVLL